MGEHCQGFERQRPQEFASNGAKPPNCLFGNQVRLSGILLTS